MKRALNFSRIVWGLFVSSGLALMFVIAGCQPEEVDSWLTDTSYDLKAAEVSPASMHKDVPSELAIVRAATAKYHNFDKAIEDGYTVEVPGYFSQMGYHYLNPDYLMDYTFDPEHPELLLYVPDKNGHMRLVGVEFAIPIDDMDNPPPAPEGFTGDSDVWTINEEAHLWTLHAWVWLHNPNGIFDHHNPRVPESDD